MQRRNNKKQIEVKKIEDEASLSLPEMPTEIKTLIFSFLLPAEKITASWVSQELRDIVYTHFGESLLHFQIQENNERNKNNLLPLAMNKIETCSDKLLVCTNNIDDNLWKMTCITYAGCMGGGILLPILWVPKTILASCCLVAAGTSAGAGAVVGCVKQNKEINRSIKENKQSFTQSRVILFAERQHRPKKEVHNEPMPLSYHF